MVDNLSKEGQVHEEMKAFKKFMAEINLKKPQWPISQKRGDSVSSNRLQMSSSMAA